MSKKLLFLAGTAVVVIAMVVVLYPFSRPIEKTLTAYGYDQAGTPVETSIRISGEVMEKPWRNQIFIGYFGIPLSDQTCREGVEAKIEWFEEGYQSILYYFNGEFSTLGVSQIRIDPDMDEIGLRLEDGTIIATSEAMMKEMSY